MINAAQKYIQELRTFLPPEVGVEVLGGMPLALHLNQPYKDIDVFITNMVLGTIDGMLLEKDEFVLCRQVLKSKSSFDYTCINKTTVLTCNIDGVDIDLIVSPKWVNRLNLVYSFDMSICQAWVEDITADIWEGRLSEYAQTSLDTKVIKYLQKQSTNSLFGAHRNRAGRIARYKEKFPGFSIIEEL